ncbi:hypothetical protein D1BOALGB6SA_6689 [Olavius sp. associated proteobacterium Delta 1]|nr:hypothetical protein D1BOALGB6SA_6689 [Olavius sp. associated proteobacterium Delta 1]
MGPETGFYRLLLFLLDKKDGAVFTCLLIPEKWIGKFQLNDRPIRRSTANWKDVNKPY